MWKVNRQHGDYTRKAGNALKILSNSCGKWVNIRSLLSRANWKNTPLFQIYLAVIMDLVIKLCKSCVDLSRDFSDGLNSVLSSSYISSYSITCLLLISNYKGGTVEQLVELLPHSFCDPGSILSSVADCVEFSHSPHVGFLQVRQFPCTSIERAG